MSKQRLISFIGFFTLFLFISKGVTQDVIEGIFQDVILSKNSDSIDIEILLNTPLRYVRHFPPKENDILQIKLDTIRSRNNVSLIQESVVAPRNNIAQLLDVIYEGKVPGGPFLTLRFRKPVRYTVEQNHGTSIIVHVEDFVEEFVPNRQKILKAPQSSRSKKNNDRMMQEARTSLSKGQHSRAIRLFNRLLSLPRNKHTEKAQELIGLALEKNGQLARATIAYEKYLRKYTKSDNKGAERVAQRLLALHKHKERPKKKLKPGGEKRKILHIDKFGRFSQRYFNSVIKSDSQGAFEGSTTRNSALATFFSLSSRARIESFDLRGVFSIYDLRDFEISDNSRLRLNSLYLDLNNKQKGIQTTIGRQSTSKGGVFGRFDGVMFNYRVQPKISIGVNFGKPVGYTESAINKNKYFYGIPLSLGRFGDRWDFNFYYFEQRVDEIIDRQAIGQDVRYTDTNYSLFQAADYDTAYQLLNMLLLKSTWNMSESSILNINYSFRRNPLLFATNALQGEVSSEVSTFSDLLRLVGELPIRDKVAKYSLQSEVFSIGATYRLTTILQLIGDLSVFKILGRDELQTLNPLNAATTLPAVEPQGPDYNVSGQIVAGNVFMPGDINSLGLQYLKGTKRDNISVFMRSRLPVGPHWRFNPKIQLSRSSNKQDSSSTKRIFTSIKIDYLWKKKINFELETGYQIYKNSGGTIPDFNRIFIVLGYSVDF